MENIVYLIHMFSITLLHLIYISNIHSYVESDSHMTLLRAEFI